MKIKKPNWTVINDDCYVSKTITGTLEVIRQRIFDGEPDDWEVYLPDSFPHKFRSVEELTFSDADTAKLMAEAAYRDALIDCMEE